MSDEPEVTITPYRDGPLLVRGPIEIVDQDGETIDAGRTPVALCRCGKSRIRPFCDGTHQTIRFTAPSGREYGRGRQTRERSAGTGSAPPSTPAPDGTPAEAARGTATDAAPPSQDG